MTCRRCGGIGGKGNEYYICSYCIIDENKEIDRQNRGRNLAIQQSQADAIRHAEIMEAEHQRWYFSLPEHEKRRWDKKVEEEKAQADRQLKEYFHNEFLRQEQERKEGERLKEYRQLNSDRIRIIEENVASKINRKNSNFGFGTWLIFLTMGVGCAAYYDQNYGRLVIGKLAEIGLAFKYHVIVIGILAGILFVLLKYFLVLISNPIKVVPREITLSESSSDDDLNVQKIEPKVLSNELLISESSKNITVPDSIFDPTVKTLSSDNLNISRNSQCPCGSGEKYKNCHGKIT